MIAIFDNHYEEDLTRSAVCCINSWGDENPIYQTCITEPKADEYKPGEFYKREMPSIIKLISQLSVDIDAIVIDGYVDLAKGRPGLGRHLYNSIQQKTPIIGVAKNLFDGSDRHIDVLRGESKKPLFVTSCGISVTQSAAAIKSMHGKFRVPTILKKVDRLARDGQ